MFGVAKELGVSFEEVEQMQVAVFQHWLAFFKIQNEKIGR